MARAKQSNRTHNILWVEGRWKSNPALVPALIQKGFSVTRVSSGKSAIERLSIRKPHAVIVDAASMHTSGERICKSLREVSDRLPIVLIANKKWGVAKDAECANVVLVMPFTQRKLMNRLVPLLPGRSQDLLKIGPIQLNVETNYVVANGKRTQLTPRLVRLLTMLIDHKGEMVARNDLFTTVWKTNYTGDTRTLDVHISWLRQAIEKDPKSPKLLKTMRGVGYRLDV